MFIQAYPFGKCWRFENLLSENSTLNALCFMEFLKNFFSETQKESEAIGFNHFTYMCGCAPRCTHIKAPNVLTNPTYTYFPNYVIATFSYRYVPEHKDLLNTLSLVHFLRSKFTLSHLILVAFLQLNHA